MEWLGVERRRLGTVLLGFGITGLVLAAIVASALLAGGIATRNLDDRLVASQERVAAALTRLTLTMDSLATTVDNASATLQTSRDGVVHASQVLTDVAATTDELATALDITILGQRPFDGTIAKLQSLSVKVKTFEGDAQKLAANLDTNATDVAQMADGVRQLRSQVAELAAAVSSFNRTGELVTMMTWGIVLGGLLTAWIAVLAAGIAWAGWRLRRAAGATTPAAAAS
jgi:uncharacterized phage infection (PIP) family protein YhgE